MITPIIIPITTTQTRDCIIQEGVRYCESQNVSHKDVGIVFGVVALFSIYCGLVVYAVTNSDTGNEFEWIFFWTIVFPLMLGSVILLVN